MNAIFVSVYKPENNISGHSGIPFANHIFDCMRDFLTWMCEQRTMPGMVFLRWGPAVTGLYNECWV